MRPQEFEFVEVLTHRIRILSIEQVTRTFFGGDFSDSRDSVRALNEQGFIECRHILARPLLSCDAPVVRWLPESDPPDFGKAAYRLKTRWIQPVAPTEIVQASNKALKCFGGYHGGRWPRTSEVTHDLHLGELYLRLRKECEDEACAWTPEAKLYVDERKDWIRLPDALIRMDGINKRLIEFGGSYGKQKLQSFHNEMNHLPYEIW